MASPSGPTLNRRESSPYLQFTPKRAMASFENLVALANHQERLREARKMIWRDRGEPAIELTDLWECFEHAGRGALRAGTLAFAIRASVNLVLALIRFKRVPKKIRFALIRHALFGPDSFRFAAMLGSFVSLYKFLLNALPILLPVPSDRNNSPFDDDDDLESGLILTSSLEVPLANRQARLSLSAQAHQMWIRKKTRRWHSIFAGAVAGGLAVMFENKSRRNVIAQQLFVRGLQGSYNLFSSKRGIRIPHGDVIVFSLACGQIIYAFLLRPDTLPRSYSNWIGEASKVSVEGVRMNRDLVREGKFNISDLEAIMAFDDVTPYNRNKLDALHALATSDPPSYGPHYGSCAIVHPAISSCAAVPLDRFFNVFTWMLPIYGALHFIPTILFKRKQFVQNPWKMLMRVGWGTTRSSAFLGVLVMIYQTFFCTRHHLHSFLSSNSSPVKVPRAFLDMIISKPSFFLGGLLSGLSLFVEEKRRRGELAMYVLPRGLESAWMTARGKGWVFKTGDFGEMLLTAIGMGMVMSTYQNDPQYLSGLVRRILYQFIGPN